MIIQKLFSQGAINELSEGDGERVRPEVLNHYEFLERGEHGLPRSWQCLIEWYKVKEYNTLPLTRKDMNIR